MKVAATTRARARAGFTVLELVIAFGATLVLLGMLVLANRASTQVTNATLTLGRLDESASQAAQVIGAELRWAQPGTLLLTTENGSDRADFFVAQDFDGTNTIWSSQITLRYEPSLGDENGNGIPDEGVLVRLQDGVRRVLCRNLELGGLSITRAGTRVDLQLSIFRLSDDRQLIESDVQTTITLINPEGA